MLTLLDNKEVLRCDDYYVRELANGLDELILSISVWDPVYPYLVEEAQIQDSGGQTYNIKQIDGGADMAKVICQLDLDAWNASLNLAYGNGITTVYNTVNAKKPSGWTVIDQSGNTLRRTVNGNLTAYEICKQCEEVYGVWFRWDNKLKTCTIHSKIMPAPVGAFATRDLNLKQINYKGKSNDIKTRLYAFGQDDMTFASINGGKAYVDNFTYTDKILPMYWKDERYTDPASLLADAITKLAEVAVPKRSYECAVVDLQAVDPEKYSFLDFSLYTTATLIDDIKNFAVNYQVVERHIYPHHPEQNVVIFDTSPEKITNIVDNTKDLLETRVTADQMQTEVDRATGVLQTGKSGYVVIGRNSDGYANEIYFLDRPSLQDAVKVLRINQAGIGFSSSGAAGPYYQAWTLDGVLSLGGVNNAYGDLQILDPSGKLISRVNKDGFTLYDTNGSTVIGSWSHTGINVKKGAISGVSIDIARGNNIGLYCNGTTFEFGDFMVSDEYGRQVLESSDEMTGMSGEPDSSDGLYLWAGYNSGNDYAFVVNEAGAYCKYGSIHYNIGEQIYELWQAVRGGGGGCTSDYSCSSDSGGCGCDGDSWHPCGCDGDCENVCSEA